MLGYAFAVGFTGLLAVGFSQASQTRCSDLLTEEQIARRKMAVNTARAINTAEARAFHEGRKFVPLAVLQNVAVPQGFNAQVSTDGETYALSVKDTEDKCQAAVFSDQHGLIYTGMPLR
jgi:hypothetical protein